MKRDTRRMILDWGRCHRLLDALQWGNHEKDLTPRIATLIKLLVRQTGWPAGEPPTEWWAPLESTPEHERRERRRKRRK